MTFSLEGVLYVKKIELSANRPSVHPSNSSLLLLFIYFFFSPSEKANLRYSLCVFVRVYSNELRPALF